MHNYAWTGNKLSPRLNPDCLVLLQESYAVGDPELRCTFTQGWLYSHRGLYYTCVCVQQLFCQVSITDACSPLYECVEHTQRSLQ